MFPVRRKVHLPIALATVIAVAGFTTGTMGAAQTAPPASSSTGSLTTIESAVRVAAVDPKAGSQAAPSATVRGDPRSGRHGAQATAVSSTLSVPDVAASAVTHQPADVAKFSGLNAVDSHNVSGFDLEPPDQGLCAGPNSVFEMINVVDRVYNKTGQPLTSPQYLNTFFADPAAEFTSDPRCLYDSASHAFFASEVEINLTKTGAFGKGSHLDLAVNPTDDPTTPWTVYHIPTTDNGANGAPKHPNCPCFGDQPLLGVDQFGVYLSTNEYGIANSVFNTAQIYAISKAQVVSLQAHPVVAHYANLHLDGHAAFSIQPALTTDASAPAEFFLQSLDFAAFITPVFACPPPSTLAEGIGVWALTHRELLGTNIAPTLSATVRQSETYGQPPCTPQRPGPAPLAEHYEAPLAQLTNDDDRMQEVTNANGTLWSSLDTVVHVHGEPAGTTRSGAAWFAVQATAAPAGITDARIAGQGHVAVSGDYLMYPAIGVDGGGMPDMVMTLAGTDYNPSAVYALGGSAGGFSDVQIAAAGTGPFDGFGCLPTGVDSGEGFCRWGDYSAAVTDPVNGNVWIATEYVPGPRDTQENWGTFVTELTAR